VLKSDYLNKFTEKELGNGQQIQVSLFKVNYNLEKILHRVNLESDCNF
jgi:hypothetical protein